MAVVTSQMQDDGFHEIQLNGKQLVFLFMAATVVSVVIFLCGVLVGRGVRAERAAVADLSSTTAAVETTPQQAVAPPRQQRRCMGALRFGRSGPDYSMPLTFPTVRPSARSKAIEASPL